MKSTSQLIDIDELMREIERYLDVVEAFRSEGCEVGGPRTPERGRMTDRKTRRDSTRAA